MEKAARNVHAEPIELLKARVRDLFQKQGWEFDEDMSAELKAFLAYKYPEFGIGSLHTLQNWTPEEYLNSLSLPKKGSSFKERTIEQIAAEVPGVFTTVIEIGIGNLHIQQNRTPEEYLNSLRLPKKGSSFKGRTIEQIAAEVPGDATIVIEIVNHLDVELTYYQLDLRNGLKHQKVAKTVAFKTREVFKFKKGPLGVLLYRVGDTGFSLHLLFDWDGFAVGFLENNAPIKTFEPIFYEGFNEYTHTGPPDSFKKERFDWEKDNTRTVTIHVGAIYAKLTVQSKPSRPIYKLFYTIEVFKFDP